MAKNPQTPRSRDFPWPCSTCRKQAVVPATVEYTVTIKHDGALHEVHVPVLRTPRCKNCGQILITNSADEQINEALRNSLRLLTPEQIRAGIGRLGLEQQQVAERIGVAPETISRWVNGALIQTRAMDNLMRVFFASPAARRLLRGRDQDPKLGTRTKVKPDATKAAERRRRTKPTRQRSTSDARH